MHSVQAILWIPRKVIVSTSHAEFLSWSWISLCPKQFNLVQFNCFYVYITLLKLKAAWKQQWHLKTVILLSTPTPAKIPAQSCLLNSCIIKHVCVLMEGRGLQVWRKPFSFFVFFCFISISWNICHSFLLGQKSTNKKGQVPLHSDILLFWPSLCPEPCKLLSLSATKIKMAQLKYSYTTRYRMSLGSCLGPFFADGLNCP